MLPFVELGEIEQLRVNLGEFVAEVFASLKRRDQRGLQQFVSQSPWDHTAVLRAVASKACAAIAPEAWVIDDTSFPKAGDQSVGAARQWCGALGKKSLCQVGVSLHAVTDTASVPVTWRLFLPAEWADPCDGRRSKAGVPEDVGHREKWRLALDAIDEARGWGLDGRIVVADAGYGQMHAFRTGLTERGLDYVTAVRADTSAHPGDAVPTVPAREGRMGAPRLPRYQEAVRSLKDLARTGSVMEHLTEKDARTPRERRARM